MNLDWHKHRGYDPHHISDTGLLLDTRWNHGDWYGASLLARPPTKWPRRKTLWITQRILLHTDIDWGNSGPAGTKLGAAGVADIGNGAGYGSRKPTKATPGMSGRWRIRQRSGPPQLGIYFYHLGQSRPDGYGDIWWFDRHYQPGLAYTFHLGIKLGSRYRPYGSIRVFESHHGGGHSKVADIRRIGWNMPLDPDLWVNAWRNPHRWPDAAGSITNITRISLEHPIYS